MAASDKDTAKGKDKPAAGKKAPERKVVRVRATKLGYYGDMLRKPGTVFNVKLGPGEKFPSWCIEVNEAGEAVNGEDEVADTTSGESKGSSSDEVI